MTSDAPCPDCPGTGGKPGTRRNLPELRGHRLIVAGVGRRVLAQRDLPGVRRRSSSTTSLPDLPRQRPGQSARPSRPASRPG